MTEVLVYRDVSGLDAIADAWDRLGEQEQRFFPSFSETKYLLQSAAVRFRILVAMEDLEVIGIACFLYSEIKMRFTMGERVLFSLPIREVSILGSSVLGAVGKDTIEEFCRIIIKELDFDLIRTGEIIAESPLHQAIRQLKEGVITSKLGQKNSIRWMIKLPGSFDDYLMSLRSTTRKSIKQYMRNFERKLPFELHVVHRPEQIDKFLSDGERISRLTYQWNVGQKLCNDDATRQRYMRLAKAGKLRCYVVYVGGRPCAFARGELNGRFYDYETPGFDPKYHKMSPGLVLLAWVIRDLIENTDCEIFDFGEGGDNRGYKSRFATSSIDCTTILLCRLYKPYPLLVFLLQEGFSLGRSLASWAIGYGWLRQRLKKLIRPSGDGQ